MKFKYISIIIVCFFFNIGIALADVEMREFRNKLCYDGDTCYVTMPALPKSLSKMTVRILVLILQS